MQWKDDLYRRSVQTVYLRLTHAQKPSKNLHPTFAKNHAGASPFENRLFFHRSHRGLAGNRSRTTAGQVKKSGKQFYYYLIKKLCWAKDCVVITLPIYHQMTSWPRAHVSRKWRHSIVLWNRKWRHHSPIPRMCSTVLVQATEKSIQLVLVHLQFLRRAHSLKGTPPSYTHSPPFHRGFKPLTG